MSYYNEQVFLKAANALKYCELNNVNYNKAYGVFKENEAEHELIKKAFQAILDYGMKLKIIQTSFGSYYTLSGDYPSDSNSALIIHVNHIIMEEQILEICKHYHGDHNSSGKMLKNFIDENTGIYIPNIDKYFDMFISSCNGCRDNSHHSFLQYFNSFKDSIENTIHKQNSTIQQLQQQIQAQNNNILNSMDDQKMIQQSPQHHQQQ